jgi:hypothetical protein
MTTGDRPSRVIAPRGGCHYVTGAKTPAVGLYGITGLRSTTFFFK